MLIKLPSGLLVAAAVSFFEVFSKALPGLFNTLVGSFFLPVLAEILPNFWENYLVLPCILIPLTNIDFFLIQIEHKSIITLLPLEIKSPWVFVVADLRFPPTQYNTTHLSIFVSSFNSLDFDQL